MAQLGSPGVQVNVIDESFYNPATPGTIPLILVATAQNKSNASGTGVAIGTSPSTANELYLATSQKDLTDRYGVPLFQKDAGGNALQGSEINEYGLFAAYSFLGASNSAYILRAGVDLGAITGRANPPVGDPVADTYWLDTSNTRFGIFEWNAADQKFASKNTLTLVSEDDVDNDFAPNPTIGTIGDYAVVVVESSNSVWYKNKDAKWVKVGSKNVTSFGPNNVVALDWVSSWPVVASRAFENIALSSVSYENIASTAAVGTGTGAGSGATFNVERFDQSYIVSVLNGGTNYEEGNVITISGALLGGTSPANDVTITVVASMLSGGTIASVDPDEVTGIAVTVSNVGMKVQVGTTIVDFFADGSTTGSNGGTAATAQELATQLNAVLNPLGVGVKLVSTVNGGILEFLTNDDIELLLSHPDSGAGNSLLTETKLGILPGTYRNPAVEFSDHTKVPFWTANDTAPRPSGSVWVKTTEFNLGAKWTVKRFNSETRLFETKESPVFVSSDEAIFRLDPLSGGVQIAVGTLFVDANYQDDGIAQFKLMYRANSGATAATVTQSNTSIVDQEVTIIETLTGQSAATAVTFNTGITINNLVTEINNRMTNVRARYENNRFTISHATGGEIGLVGAVWGALGFSASVENVYLGPTGINFKVSNWQPLADLGDGYVTGPAQPTDSPANNTIWYATYQDQVDIMVHDGTTWKGLREVFPNASVIVSASRPSNTGRVSGDIWVDTSDQDQYGKNIKRWNQGTLNWDAIDVTDHTSQFGIIFGDARWGLSGATGDVLVTDIREYWSSNFLDPDAPDSSAYPRGMLLWNTRRSGFNIKQYKRGYINPNERNPRFNNELMTAYANHTDRWVSVSGQDLNQVAYFGRRAQRAFVVGQLKVAINTNQRILDEDNIFFNLIACPGYPELISDMVNLNSARNGTALVVGDTPMRLASDGNSLVNYGTDYLNTGIDGEEGLHTNSDHLAVYYPSGLTTDLTGSNVVVPASHMMLRTIAISDQRSFQWFAPAGTRRGGITNASSVGYLRDGSFVPTSLNQGLRDQMAQIKINPITNIPGAGLVAFGQQTKTGVNSSLDRINVARLVSYLRRQLGIITKPFLFEPNDKQTRSEIKNVCESLMLDLVSLRGIYDFIVVCDETNNTPSIIANNQLYVDIAVEPVKAVEFIYIPLRLKNVGDIRSRQ